MTRYLRNAVNSLEARQIVLLEYDTACPQLRDGRVDVVNLPCQLSVIARRDAGRFKQREPAVSTLVAKTTGPLLAGC